MRARGPSVVKAAFDGTFMLDPVWTAVAVPGAVLFVVVRHLKKHTSVLTVAPDA